MAIHILTLLPHPTVISPAISDGQFQGWGIRIGG
jgi:hypothetical protein